MANSFYYKIVGDTMFYSDINEDGTFTETTLYDSGNIASCKYARPYKEGMAIPYDNVGYNHPFNNNTYEEIDFSGFDCITTKRMGNLFSGNPNLKHVKFGNHIPNSKENSGQTHFAYCGENAEELTIEGTVALNNGDLGAWFYDSKYKSIKFKNFIVNYEGKWGFSGGALWYNDVLEKLDFSGIETTGIFDLKVEVKPTIFNTLILPTYSKTRALYSITSKIYSTVDTLTIKGDLTGLKSFAGMFNNIKSNVLDISKLKYDDDINNLNVAFRDMNCTTIYATKNIYNGQSITGGGNPPFAGCPNLVGGSGSAKSTYGNGVQYARIDGGPDSPGYFTMGTPEYNLVIDVIPAGAATITYRQERDEFTFDVEYTPDYTFNYFYYKDPLGNYGEKVKSLNKAIIPITEPGTYTAYFRFEKALNPFDPDNPGGGTTPIKDLPSDVLGDKTASSKVEEMVNGYKSNTGRGVYKIYIPSKEQFNNWLTALYSEDLLTKLENLPKDIDGIQDLILGYNILPVKLTKDSSSILYFGFFDYLSEITAWNSLEFDYTDKKNIEVDMGEITIDRVWDNFLDFSPYTSIKIYLPFIGEQTLDNDDIMGKVIHLKYNIELLTGNCTAYILVNNSVHYQFTGNCLYQIPLASNDFAEIKNNYIQNIASSISKMTISDFSKDDQAGAVSGLATNTAALVTQKPRAGDKANCLSGNSAYNNLPYPYITFTRRLPAAPKNYGHNNGFVCLKTLKIEDLKGYTEIAKIHLEGLPFTDNELKELETILQEGVIL